MRPKNLWICGCILAVVLFAGCSSTASSTKAQSQSSQSSETEESSSAVSSSEESSIEDSGEESNTESSQSDSASRDVFAMDTYMTVTAYGEDAEEAVDAAAAEIERLDALFSVGDEDSDIAKVNANGGGELSEESGYLVERSLELYEDTDGAFDIAIYPVMEAWGFTTQDYKVPSDDVLSAALKLTDASLINYDSSSRTISFDMDEMKIDLGGIAKGYTSARIMDIFREYNLTSGLVNLGGNVQAYKSKTDGSDWRVAIQDPDNLDDYVGVLSISDKAVITSGGYERYFEEDGKTYHHIIDPKTGYPADSGLTSVTIVSTDGTLADGLSTSLFIMGKDKAEEYWRNHSDEFDAVLITQDGTIYVTEGIQDCFSSERTVEVISK